VTIHRLRQLLGQPEALRVERGCLSINRQIVWLDLLGLRQELAAFERDKGKRENAELHKAIARIQKLYLGPLLGEVEESWAATPRLRLRQTYEQFLRTASAELQHNGDTNGVHALLNEALSRDPALRIQVPP
jgi:two-component SAPR family response regulator